MKKISFLLLLPFAAFAQQAEKEFKLNGELKLAKPAEWVYLNYRSGDQVITDSVQIKNNQFQFQGKLAEPTVASLAVKYAAAEGERPKREGVSLFLEPSTLKFSASDSLSNLSLAGSKGQSDLDKLVAGTKSYNARINPLLDEYRTAAKASDKATTDRVEKEIEKIENEMKEKVYGDFIRKNSKSPVALYALKQYAGWEIDPAAVEPLFNSLPEATRKLASAVAFKEQVDIAKKTAIGSYAMDFTQADTLGNPVKLSSFKGKYVLVDFWASWCGPCRRENPNVVKAFNTYKDRNFTVLGVSLDRPNAKDKWLKAIHDDNLTWTQVSDLKYWDNEVAKQYGIRAIPQNLLLDASGKIVAKNIRGEELTKKLEEILPK